AVFRLGAQADEVGVVEFVLARFRQVAAFSGIQQNMLAKKLGGFSPQVLSRLANGESKTIPIDLLTNLAGWAAANSISLRWLFTGFGPMTVAPTSGCPFADLIRTLSERIAS
ncbi:hypothetical protein LCGC14_3018580, partial [marine sediment metagenome]